MTDIDRVRKSILSYVCWQFNRELNLARDFIAEIESVRSRADGSGRRLGSARVTLELYKIATGPLLSD